MKIKNILSVAAFVLAFVASSAFASLFVARTQPGSDFFLVDNYKSNIGFSDRRNSATANKIFALLLEDQKNERERNKKTYSLGSSVRSPFTSTKFSEYSEAVEQYADASGSLRTDDLPSDFKAAWREHMKAWHDKSNFLNQTKKSVNRNALSEETYNDNYALHSREITRTWQEVLRIGRSYGADFY